MDGSPHIAPEPASPEPPAGKYAAALDRLVFIGMEIAERLGADVKADGADAGKIAVAFGRVAKAVRQTVALEAMLADQAKVRAESERQRAERARKQTERASPWLAWGMTEEEFVAQEQRVQEGQAAERLLERVIERDAPERMREALTLDFRERLDDEDDLFMTGAPIAQVIAAICQGLGLSPDWAGLDEADWGEIDLATRVALKMPERARRRSEPGPAEACADP